MSAPDRWPNRLEIDPSVYLAPGAIVAGEVKIGARSSVWFNTVLRGDTDAIVVGEDSNLQDLTIVHMDEGFPALIGNRVTVGHRSIIHGCVIGDDCLIGMGAIVLSGAKIGAGSLIGAGALIKEGQEIPPGSLAVGAPARVIGPVGESHRGAIERGTRHYVALSREYLARGYGQPIPAAHEARGALGVAPADMTFVEWGRLLAELAYSPRWAQMRLDEVGTGLWTRAPGPERWSADDVIDHLLASDIQVFGLRLERMLTTERPSLEGAYGNRMDTLLTPAERMERWRVERGALISRLVTFGPQEWVRTGLHATIGYYSIGRMVRAWADHDILHRRQIEAAIAGVLR